MVHGQLPDDGEVAGLLALMLLTDSRRPTRTDAAGDLVPLADRTGTLGRRPDRRRHRARQRGVGRSPLGPYQLQAAIAATHAGRRGRRTDWEQVHTLYKILERIAPNPMVTLNRAVALAETRGPRAGLDLLATLDADERMTDHHRLHAVRAHLLEQTGDVAAAQQEYRLAARLTASRAEQRYLELRASRLKDGAPSAVAPVGEVSS